MESHSSVRHPDRDLLWRRPANSSWVQVALGRISLRASATASLQPLPLLWCFTPQ